MLIREYYIGVLQSGYTNPNITNQNSVFNINIEMKQTPTNSNMLFPMSSIRCEKAKINKLSDIAKPRKVALHL